MEVTMKRLILILVLLPSLIGSSASVMGQGGGEHPVITLENADQVDQLAILGFGEIQAVAWSPDGQEVAVASTTGILIYNAEYFDTAPHERLFTSQAYTSGVAYSPDGRLLAGMTCPDWSKSTNDDKETIHIWDAVTHVVLAEWDVELPYYCPQLEFGPDSQSLALHYGDSSNIIGEIWDVSALPDVQRIGTFSYEETRALWYPPPDFDQLDFPDLTGATMIAASRDHQWVAAYDGQGVIRVWNLAQQQEQFVVNLRNLADAPETDRVPEVSSLSFTPHGSLLQVGYYFELTQCAGEIRMWDTASGEEVLWLSPCVTGARRMTFSPDEKHMLMIYFPDLSLVLWDRLTGTLRDVLGNSENRRKGAIGNFAMSVAFSPDSTLLAVSRNSWIEIWDMRTRTRITSLPTYGYIGDHTAFSADGKILAVYGGQGARFYDMDTFQEIASLEGVDRIYDISFSPDGRWLAAQLEVRDEAQDRSMLTLWEVDAFWERGYNQPGMENTRLVYLYGANMYSDPVAFSPDSTMLAGMGVSNVYIWDIEQALDFERIQIETGQPLPEAVIGSVPIDATAWQIAFSPDGRSLAVDNVVYDTETWSERVTLEGHTGTVTSVTFSPDGALIATSSGSTFGWFSSDSEEPDDTVRLWDAQTGELLAALEGHTEGVRQVVFSPDGQLLASGSGATIREVSHDGTVRLWGVP
jgi:WD40 repeat protein